MEAIFESLLGLVTDWGYLGIFVLMILEGSFLPLSSKLIIWPSAYLAQQGYMNVYFLVFIAVTGNLIGASINYIVARKLGRPILKHFSEKKIHKAEKFFKKYGEMSVFLGGLVSGVRQIMPISAGLVKMPYTKFIFLTGLASSIWLIFLAAIGYVFGANEELLLDHSIAISIGFVILALLILPVFLIRKK
jgi:membrane protein DedA with SNARE-associated domain